jgi:hypothetical protein
VDYEAGIRIATAVIVPAVMMEMTVVVMVEVIVLVSFCAGKGQTKQSEK